MTRPGTIKYIALFIGIFAFSGPFLKADNLESLFKETGWDRIVGTWQADNGMNTGFAWKSAGAVLESVTTMGDTQRFSLMNRNGKSGSVYVLEIVVKGRPEAIKLTRK